MTAQSAPDRVMTLEEFEARFAGKRYEYVDGRAVPMGPEISLPNGEVVVTPETAGHGLLVSEIGAAVGEFVCEHKLGQVFAAGTGFWIKLNIRAADVAFITAERMKAVKRGEWLPFPPDLAVEVISQYDKAQEIRDKAEEYMENGTRLLWIVYPERRIIDVHRSGQPIVKHAAGDRLDGGDVLPGFSIPVEELFAPLDTLGE